MFKKISIFTFLILIVLSLNSFIFANNGVNLGEEVKDSMHKAGEAAGNAATRS